MVSNPAYAGAYAYGQRRQEGSGLIGLGPRGPRRRWALDQVEILLRDHHPGYITWAQYETNRATLRDNSRQFASSRGAPQPGQGLLQGIVVCGRCGCRMRPHHSVSSPSYLCRTRKQRYGEPVCQSLSMAHVDTAVSAAFLAVIRPAELEASLALADDLAQDQAQVEQQWQLRLERARYEAERAQRQYDQVEPENRLVARELERRWNEKLRAVAALDAEYHQEQERGLSPLTEEEKNDLRALVSHASTLWQAAHTTMDERKRLLRCLVSEVIVQRDGAAKNAGGQTTVRIGWRSGAWTELRVRRPSSTDALRTPEQVLDRIRALAQQESDARIAQILTAEGQCTRWGLAWTALRVQRVRAYQHIPTACPVLPQGPHARGDGLLPVATAAAQVGVVPTALPHWRRWGFLHAEQQGPGSPLWVRLTAQDRARLDGTLAAQGYGQWRLREAQQALGLSRDQVYEAARRGDLIAYRARVGGHWEWRLSPAQAACVG